MSNTHALDPLPEPAGVIVVNTQALRAFTADQMRAFAAAAVAEERERRAADARLAAYVRQHAEPAFDGWRIDVWINGAPALETLDDALKA